MIGKENVFNVKMDICLKKDQNFKMNENIDKGKKISLDFDKEEIFIDRGIKIVLEEELDLEVKMIGENKQINLNRGLKEVVDEDKIIVVKVEMIVLKFVFDKVDDISFVNELIVEVIDEILELVWSICDGYFRCFLIEYFQCYYFYIEYCKYCIEGYNRFVSYVKYVFDKYDIVQFYRIQLKI